jgi:Na+/proline symporter
VLFVSFLIQNGAFPIGDQRVFSAQMSDPLVLSPFPNAIYWNWATIFILAFGNLGALDFQVRCMAAKTPNTARIGCIIGGLFTFFIGIPFAYLGAIVRNYYGPDSIHAHFEADTCSEHLLLPSCGEWKPDPVGFLNLLTNQAPGWVGGWCLIGIVAASMSTADGAILAMGTVFSHNLMRQLDFKWPNLVNSDNLLLMARLSTIPFTLASTLIGAYYRSSDSAAGATGYLLIVAFDIVLATVVVPLFGCFYTKNPSPRAAFCSIIFGILTRVILEFALPKDGFLLLPFDEPEFENYGIGASLKLPPFVDAPPEAVWDPAVEVCEQELYRDFTGVDSIAAFLVSVISFCLIQTVEFKNGGTPLFTLPGMVPYAKECQTEKLVDETMETAANDGTDEEVEIYFEVEA